MPVSGSDGQYFETEWDYVVDQLNNQSTPVKAEDGNKFLSSGETDYSQYFMPTIARDQNDPFNWGLSEALAELGTKPDYGKESEEDPSLPPYSEFIATTKHVQEDQKPWYQKTYESFMSNWTGPQVIDRGKKGDLDKTPFKENIWGGDFNDPYGSFVRHLEAMGDDRLPFSKIKIEDVKGMSWKELIGYGLLTGMGLTGSRSLAGSSSSLAPKMEVFTDMSKREFLKGLGSAIASVSLPTKESFFFKQAGAVKQQPFFSPEEAFGNLDFLMGKAKAWGVNSLETSELHQLAYVKKVQPMVWDEAVKMAFKPIPGPPEWLTEFMPDKTTLAPKGWGKAGGPGDDLTPTDLAKFEREHVVSERHPKELLDSYKELQEKYGITIPKDAKKNDFDTIAFRGVSKPPRRNIENDFFEQYSAAHPDLSNLYATSNWTAPEGKQSVPLLLKTKDYLVVDAKGKTWVQINDSALAIARQKDKPGVVIHNVWDEPGTKGSLPKPQTVFIALKAETTRSRFAKFKDVKSGDMLGGLAFPMVLYGLSDTEE